MKHIFCKLFGHKWTYYRITEPTRYIRVCNICHEMHDRKVVFGPDPIWSITLQYKKYGAKLHVPGYEP